MKLASYYGTKAGLMGLGNILIRYRLKGIYSHTEVAFEPGDGVDAFMPDGTTEPNEDGQVWCASSTGLDHIPLWSNARPGKLGGVRFKRIKLDPKKWHLDDTTGDPIKAALWVKFNEGMLYDWQLIIGFIAWFIPDKSGRVMCSEACAEMLGYKDAWRIDPCLLQLVNKHNVNFDK
jgi:hypothetical protein